MPRCRIMALLQLYSMRVLTTVRHGAGSRPTTGLLTCKSCPLLSCSEARKCSIVFRHCLTVKWPSMNLTSSQERAKWWDLLNSHCPNALRYRYSWYLPQKVPSTWKREGGYNCKRYQCQWLVWTLCCRGPPYRVSLLTMCSLTPRRHSKRGRSLSVCEGGRIHTAPGDL